MPIHKAGVWLTHGFYAANRANRARQNGGLVLLNNGPRQTCLVVGVVVVGVVARVVSVVSLFPSVALTAFAFAFALRFGGALVRRARSERIIGFYLCY